MINRAEKHATPVRSQISRWKERKSCSTSTGKDPGSTLGLTLPSSSSPRSSLKNLSLSTNSCSAQCFYRPKQSKGSPASSCLVLLMSILALVESGGAPEIAGITLVKLFDTYDGALTALAGSGISVVVALPNEQLSSAASDQSFTDSWVQSNISKYYPSTKIVTIAVGNEVFADPNNPTAFLVPAMNNVYASLVKYNLAGISVSSPIAMSSLQTSYPTSAGSFKSDLVEPVIKPMLEFLRKTGSYLMVNVYPFFAYMANSDQISLDYALFKQNPGAVDPGSGLKYYGLFDAQVDALVVTETGWPLKVDANEVGAGLENVVANNGNMLKRVLMGSGTPLRPNNTMDVYLFALFNENQKPGPTSYIRLTLEQLESGANNRVPPGLAERTWFMADGRDWAKKVQAGLDYACGEGGADCQPIQRGSASCEPNTVEAHASYARFFTLIRITEYGDCGVPRG
ncbi:hypothetical protein ACJRO7_025338 [Eucalyptus globulus]|uniref:glucan endo-1,3-beta-D-glucosidase n=1 Tax=Eucalyptus globulus TaxID=34317 RepID=A0ABD3KAJ7_EUCGL